MNALMIGKLADMFHARAGADDPPLAPITRQWAVHRAAGRGRFAMLWPRTWAILRL